jgi:hypothetical protein
MQSFDELAVQALVFGTSISVVSWMVGIIGIHWVAKSAWYPRLQHLNFIPDPAANRYLGIWVFRWIVRDTPFRFFNQAVRLREGRADLQRIRDAMTHAEVSHLIGFGFVVPFAVFKGFAVGWGFAALMMGPNVLLNLYPALLQQENKRRIDRLLVRARRS